MQTFVKRVMDFLGAAAGLVILSPLFAIIAFLIKWDSEGPVFVKLKRVSQGKEFYLYKFRSMVKNAEKLKKDLLHLNERKDGPFFKIKNDPRVTKFGRFLRRYHLDELPQLINVLKGEISLVGPRPHEPEEVDTYKNKYKDIVLAKAGITGLAQVSGASSLSFEEEIRLDYEYIKNFSIFLDIKILFKTLIKIFLSKESNQNE